MLDFLSTPARCVLGGRNVNILSLTETDPTSTAGKVATVFFSVLIFPVAAVSITSLLLKLATFPWIWEKKLIEVETTQSLNVIDAFHQAFDNHEYEAAIKNLKLRPDIDLRTDVNIKVYKLIDRKIHNLHPWEEIQDLLPHLSTEDCAILINQMVQKRLEHVVEDDRLNMNGDQILHLIKNSLRYKSVKNIKTCCNKLLSGALQINPKDDVTTKEVKSSIRSKLIY